MSAPATNPYDLVPYESHPFQQTHPDRLSTIATLFGLRSAPLQRCRVLELGCASGGNLIPMALQLPTSQFVGVDLSGREVGDGQRVVERLGLTNISLRHASILDVDDSYEKFDYILCHGVFSWVPNEVQEKILAIAHANLNPNGIAYISYNTYPGWHMRGLIREMMRYHAENYATPKLRTRQARALLDFMASSVRQDGSVYSSLLKQELELLRHQADSYLFHEHLEDVNDPIFFHRFAQRAEAHGLQYLGEARISSMLLSSFQPDVEKTLRMLATDQIQAEQYMDFLRNRTFRETLLCHKAAPVNWGVQPEVLRRLHIASHAVPVKGPVDIQSKDEVTYRTPSGHGMATTQPLLKAVLECLHEAWPRPLPFDRLRALVRERLGGNLTDQQAAEEQAFLATGLLSGYMGSDLIELHSWPMEFVTVVNERPVACPYARLQAADGYHVTNRRHEMIRLNPFQHVVLSLLDGQHDKVAILDKMVEAALSEKISVHRGDVEIQDAETIRGMLPPLVNQCLSELSRMALLVG